MKLNNQKKYELELRLRLQQPQKKYVGNLYGVGNVEKIRFFYFLKLQNL